MTPQTVIDIFSEALWLVILIASVLVMPGLLVGLLISIFQAATQINEQTLSFFPRLIVTLTALIIAGPFLLNKLIEFTRTLVASVPGLVG